jgi:hypothetical protein
MVDRYECIAQAQQHVSNPLTVISGKGSEQPNCESWTSCMKARGYTLDPNGSLGVPPRMAIQCVR